MHSLSPVDIGYFLGTLYSDPTWLMVIQLEVIIKVTEETILRQMRKLIVIHGHA